VYERIEGRKEEELKEEIEVLLLPIDI